MANRKKFIVSVGFLILLAVASVMAIGEEIGRFAEKGTTEKGSGKFYVGRTLFAAGIAIKAGEYNVTWESKGPDATVDFTLVGKSHGVKVPGKLVDVKEKYEFDSIAIAKDPDGRDVIKELQFGGKKEEIIFDCNDPSCLNLRGNSEFPSYHASEV